MNIYKKINSIRKQIRILEEQQTKEITRYNNKFGNKYSIMPFKPGTMIIAENNLMKLAGIIRELQTDLNRLVLQNGDEKVIEWYNETNQEGISL